MAIQRMTDEIGVADVLAALAAECHDRARSAREMPDAGLATSWTAAAGDVDALARRTERRICDCCPRT